MLRRPVHRGSVRLAGGAAVIALLVTVTGCGATPAGAPKVTGPFAACAPGPGVGSASPSDVPSAFPSDVPSVSARDAPSGSAGDVPSSSAGDVRSGPATRTATDAPMMAALSLPCFAGGPAVELTRLGRPAVLNLWASWCGPCRAELPVFQQFADGPAGRIAVLGVVTGDTRSAAASFAQDRSVTFPALFDPDSKLQRSGLMPLVLPVTLFVDAGGRVRHVEAVPIKDLSTLDSLAHRYLAVGS